MPKEEKSCPYRGWNSDHSAVQTAARRFPDINSVKFTSSSLTVRKRTHETFFNIVTKINAYNIKTLFSQV
jgi:hypothetical protein